MRLQAGEKERGMGIERILHRRGTVFVLSAPSGTGKDTVIARVLQEMPLVRRCITVTTRDPAPGEANGVDYFFVSVPEFHTMRGQGEFLEWAEVHGNFYGTPRWWVLQQIEQGRDVVLVIDTQGARSVRERLPDVVTIFLAPPSLAELERRIRARGRDDEQDIRTRLGNAANELDCIGEYNYLVINDDLETAVASVKSAFTAEALRIRPETPVHEIVGAILSTGTDGTNGKTGRVC